MTTENLNGHLAGILGCPSLQAARIRCVLYRAISFIFLLITLVYMAPVVRDRFFNFQS